MVIGAILLFSSSVSAWDPVFEEPFQIETVTGDFDFASHPDPCIADWDGDGLEDLIVGQFSGGKIKWWKNVGSLGDPQFSYQGLIYADGSPISVGGT